MNSSLCSSRPQHARASGGEAAAAAALWVPPFTFAATARATGGDGIGLAADGAPLEAATTAAGNIVGPETLAALAKGSPTTKVASALAACSRGRLRRSLGGPGHGCCWRGRRLGR